MGHHARSRLLDLPGELQQHIRDSIQLLEWNDDVSAEIATHLALLQATESSLCVLYDEAFWRKLCFRLGFGGSDGEIGTSWEKVARSIIDPSALKYPGDQNRLQSVVRWFKESAPALDVHFPSSSHFRLNPLFDAAYLNWWTSARLHSRSSSIHSPAVVPVLTQTQKDDIPRSFWITPHRLCTTADDVLVDLDPMQRSDAAICSFATSPPTTKLTLAFCPDYKDVLSPPPSDQSENTNRSESAVEIRRDEGVRVVDVVRSMQIWLQTPLTPTQTRLLVHDLRQRNRGIFQVLEESTDEDTLQAWIERTFDRRGALLIGEFASLDLEITTEGGLRAVVLCGPRSSSLSELSASMIV
ncbi:hypothetical protein FRB93_003863 [Tulasnella sp. JGI-2019a]|nr:hypothetical protein FRB93_003863 [Tulasnella sp. JGI-2019a]